MSYLKNYRLDVNTDINGVNFVSSHLVNPALLNAFFQVEREKK